MSISRTDRWITTTEWRKNAFLYFLRAEKYVCLVEIYFSRFRAEKRELCLRKVLEEVSRITLEYEIVPTQQDSPLHTANWASLTYSTAQEPRNPAEYCLWVRVDSCMKRMTASEFTCSGYQAATCLLLVELRSSSSISWYLPYRRCV